MQNKYATLLESLNQPLPPGFETVSGKLPSTLLNDLAFRIVFESNQDCLKKLLCALLHMKESEIKNIKLNKSILLGEQIPDKKYIFDLSILMNNDKIIHLELQVLSQTYWAERSLCYLCENFKQLNAGEDYDQLKPLIQIDILDFELYENSKEFYATYHLANDKNHRIYSDKLSLHVLELNKEGYATEEDKSYRIDYWARLFKATTWEELKQLATEYTDLQSTVEAIYRVNADEQALAEIIEHERYLRDQRTQQSIMQRQTATITEQANTIAVQKQKIAAQVSKIAEKDAEIEKLRAEMEAREDYLRQQRTIQNRLERLNAALADTEQQLAAQHQKLNKLFVREPRAGSPFFTCQFC